MPQSYFDRVLDLDSQVELLCWGLVAVETLGAYPARKNAEISDDKFVDAANASRPWVASALRKLEGSGMIIVSRDRHEYQRPGDDVPAIGGRATYALADEYVAEAKNAGKERPTGRCPHCKTISAFETRFIPTPHIALRKMGACLPPATFKVTMAILSKTVEWNREAKCIDVVPSVIEKRELMTMTGLEDRQITAAINDAGQRGIVSRQRIEGKPSLFWVNPEMFSHMQKRQPRQVNQPTPTGKQKAKKDPEESAKTPVKPAATPAVESNHKFYGRCTACGQFGDAEPVSDEELADAQPKPTARAGPPRKPVVPEAQIFSTHKTFTGWK